MYKHRTIDIVSAEMSGLGPHGFESGKGTVFRTGQRNKNNVHWLIASTSEGDGWSEIKMVVNFVIAFTLNVCDDRLYFLKRCFCVIVMSFRQNI